MLSLLKKSVYVKVRKSKNKLLCKYAAERKKNLKISIIDNFLLLNRKWRKIYFNLIHDILIVQQYYFNFSLIFVKIGKLDPDVHDPRMSSVARSKRAIPPRPLPDFEQKKLNQFIFRNFKFYL